MPEIKDVCIDAVCGTCLGVCQGVFGMSLFTSEELEEVNNHIKLHNTLNYGVFCLSIK